jgi:hypothetical protein
VCHSVANEFGLANKHELLWLCVSELRQKYIIGVLYHPPKAYHHTNEFIDRIHSDTEELVSLHSNPSLFLVGDFNTWDLVKFSSYNGLFQLVTQ